MIRKPLTIVNKLGLHARAAAKFVSTASGFESEIHLIKQLGLNTRVFPNLIRCRFASSQIPNLIVVDHGTVADRAVPERRAA